MSKTPAQLAVRVLFRLNVLASGETPTAEDSETVQEFYASTFGEMEDDGLTFWEVDDIPERAFEAVADFIAGRIAPEFGQAKPDLEASGRSRLQRMSAMGSTGLPVTGSFI
jgi:hypothetical protein